LMRKFSNKVFSNKQLIGKYAINWQVRYYAKDHHEELKNEAYLSEKYIQKWGFPTQQETQQWEQSIENDLEEIFKKYDAKRKETINSWTTAQKYPWYSAEELKEREELLALYQKADELTEEARIKEESEKERTFDLDATFGEKSRPILWARYFARHGKKAPPEPKSIIKPTCNAPFDTTDWKFLTLPIHCERWQEIEYQYVHPTRRLVNRYLDFWVDHGFRKRGTELKEKEIQSLPEEQKNKFGKLKVEYQQMREELDQLIPINIDRFIIPSLSPLPSNYKAFIAKLDLH